jgi:queuine tRNA-ribosyltransferase
LSDAVFRVTASPEGTPARRGVLTTPHGDVNTPAFMSVGTKATVKTMAPTELRSCGAEIVLANTYHLFLRPGPELIAAAGGLHGFMAWDGPVLTDSGGFQVFSLADARKITEEGAEFRSAIDGTKLMLSPEKAMEVQNALGADVIMAFDECIPHPSDRAYVEESVERTLRWAARCITAHARDDQLLFGIVQGGMYEDLRRVSAERTVALGFPGYAIGGLGVGEEKPLLYDMVAHTAPLLPADSPRYLMGIGTPEDILHAVRCGVDMFDCVLPTRNARHGFLWTSTGPVRIRNAQYREDLAPLDAACDCSTCTRFSRAYLRHLYVEQEGLVARLLTHHNLYFYLSMMVGVRDALRAGDVAALSSSAEDLFLRGVATQQDGRP